MEKLKVQCGILSTVRINTRTMDKMKRALFKHLNKEIEEKENEINNKHKQTSRFNINLY